MAMNKTRYWRKAMLDHCFCRVNSPFPAHMWMGLCSADPTELGLLSAELSQLGYARVDIAALMGDAVLGSGQIANAADITFGPAGEDWAEITHAVIVDSATIGAGNVRYFGPATTSRIVENGDEFIVRIGQLTVIER